jgi:hypothetical protein
MSAEGFECTDFVSLRLDRLKRVQTHMTVVTPVNTKRDGPRFSPKILVPLTLSLGDYNNFIDSDEDPI